MRVQKSAKGWGRVNVGERCVIDNITFVYIVKPWLNRNNINLNKLEKKIPLIVYKNCYPYIYRQKENNRNEGIYYLIFTISHKTPLIIRTDPKRFFQRGGGGGFQRIIVLISSFGYFKFFLVTTGVRRIYYKKYNAWFKNHINVTNPKKNKILNWTQKTEYLTNDSAWIWNRSLWNLH